MPVKPATTHQVQAGLRLRPHRMERLDRVVLVGLGVAGRDDEGIPDRVVLEDAHSVDEVVESREVRVEHVQDDVGRQPGGEGCEADDVCSQERGSQWGGKSRTPQHIDT